jgi:hypothetical protein
MHQVSWATDLGDEGTWQFGSEVEAVEAALAVKGTALVSRLPAGSVAVYRHGRELEDAEASDAVLRFGCHIEVGISRPGEPDTNVDPDDTSGSGWRPGSPDVWGWRLWRGKDGPTLWVGTYMSRELAQASAEEARAAAERGDEGADPPLAGLPIVDIGPTST